MLQTEQARLQAVERVAAVHAAKEEVLHIANADARVATLARERERQAKGARQTAELLAEAEAEVILAHQPPHAVDAFVEVRPPFAELRRRRIAALQPVDDGVRGELS